jgi:hypothetical protein
VQKLKITAVFVVGILIGAGIIESFHVVRGRLRREFFEQRIRCKNLAEIYAKTNSDDHTSLFVDRTDFSTARNSCVASISKATSGFWTYQVVDVITGEPLFTGFCDGKDSQSSSFCGGGRDINLMHKRDSEFDEVVK